MRLLYCYVQFLNEQGQPVSYRGLEKIELNFSAVDRFSYNSQTNALERKARCCPLPENFWLNNLSGSEQTTNIYNINVISGENGSGKTTAIHYLIDLLDGLHAAADPAVKDRDRMETLGLAGNRTLLLLEEAGKQYLLDYSTAAYENLHLFKTQGFSEGRLQIFHCGNARKHFGKRNDGLESFSALLGGTKVVYLTNTLSQHDYERHIGERNERLRDFFVYDASLGSTIGPDIARFFPYEVYKQVLYVFDKNHAEKHLAYRERFPELGMPHALRFHLRLEILNKVFPKNVFFDSILSSANTSMVDLFLSDKFPQQNSQRDSHIIKLLSLLGHLCVAALVENLRALMDFSYHLPDRSNFMHEAELSVLHEYILALISDVETQFEHTLRLNILNGYSGIVTCIDILPDGHVVSGSSDGTLRVWEIDQGKCLQVLEHGGWVRCLAVLPNGCVVSGADDNILRVWNANKGQCLRRLKNHNRWVTCIVVLPDGYVVSGSADGTLQLWDTDREKSIQVMEGHSGEISCLATLTEGRVVSGSDDNSLRVWDTDTGQCLHVLEGHRKRVSCVAVHPDGRIVSGSDDETLRIWDANTGNCLKILNGHSNKINCVVVLPDGHIVSGSDDNNLRVWDADGSKCLHVLKGHRDCVKCVAVLPDGHVVSGSDDSSLRIWDTDRGSCLQILEGHSGWVTCLATLPNGRVVSGSRDGRIAVNNKSAIEKARALRDSCIDYVHFMNDKADSLFSRFRWIGEGTYELPLDSLENVRSLAQSCGKSRTQAEEEAEALYRDLITFMQKYVATCKPTYTLDFDWGLSSGEENMLRLFSNLFYIFDRTDGGGRSVIYNNESHSDNNSEKTPCDSVLLFMDEADLTLHPEWQRRLISVLTAFLPQLYPASCAKDMQLILSTHSPLILGDIPSENITYLPSKKNTAEDKKRPIPEETFGQNIHTILKESFFLENGTVGDFAAKKINFIAQRLTEIEKQASGKEPINHDPSEELKELQRLIHIIAPGVLRARLEQLYRAAEVAVNRLETTGAKTTVEKLLSDVQSLSKDQRRRLLEALNKECGADD